MCEYVAWDFKKMFWEECWTILDLFTIKKKKNKNTKKTTTKNKNKNKHKTLKIKET